jgi:hypothetical protein
MKKETLEVHVVLLDEGSPTLRVIQALDLGHEKYKLLAINYDPDDEKWQFPPESVVKCKKTKDYRGNDILLAYELA